MTLPALYRYESARTSLREAHRVDEVKEIRNKAMAVQAYARQAEDDELLRLATDIKARAERKAGELLETMAISGERDGLGGDRKSTFPQGHVDRPPTLKELGVSRKQSSRWQRLASIPESIFENYLAQAKLPSTKTMLAGLLADAKRAENQSVAPVSEKTCTLADLDDVDVEFGTIYADPPWLYDNQGTRAATSNHYHGMTVDELCALPVGRLAAKDAHLHLWTTNAFLFECPRIFAAWGFEFRSSFVWVKTQMGIGNYWRNSHEFLLTAIRGSAKSFADKGLRSWLECGRGPHSAKPDQVRSMIERASPGPRLELFGRRPAKGWHVWGDQIERDLVSMAAEA